MGYSLDNFIPSQEQEGQQIRRPSYSLDNFVPNPPTESIPQMLGRNVKKAAVGTLQDVGKIANIIRWPFDRFIWYPIGVAGEKLQGSEEAKSPSMDEFLHSPLAPLERIWNNYYKSIRGTDAPDWYKQLATVGTIAGIEPGIISGAETGAELALTRVATEEEATTIKNAFDPIKQSLSKVGIDAKKLHPEGNIITLSDNSELFLNNRVSAVLRGDEIRIPRWAKINVQESLPEPEPLPENYLDNLPLTTKSIVPVSASEAEETIGLEQEDVLKQSDYDKFMKEYEKESQGKLHSIIRENGGIAPYKKLGAGSLGEEFNENVPKHLRRKEGLTLDVMAATLKENHPYLGIENENDLLQAFKGESGEVNIGIITETPAMAAKAVKDYIETSTKTLPITKDIEKGFVQLKTQSIADDIRAKKLLEQIELSPQDAEAIYHHQENPQEPLSERQQEIYDKVVKPLADRAAEIFSKIRNQGIPIPTEGYTPRFIEGKGNLFDRIKNKVESVGRGVSGLFKKTSGSFKTRVMKALVDDDGNRKVVSIKDNKVTEWKDREAIPLGELKRDLPAPVTEYYDEQLTNQLEELAKSLGIKHERLVKLRAWSKLGLSFPGQKYIETKAGGPEGVLLHEIGHQIDEMYDLQHKFIDVKVSDLKGIKKLQEAEIKRELRALVDLKYEGKEVKPSFKTYVRKGEEKIAAMFEALITAPEKFQEVAPTLYKKFTEFLASEPKLKPILDLKRSMVIGGQTVGEVDEGGIFTDKAGKKWKVAEATTREIEQHTDLTYHKNAILNNLVHYNELRKIDRATEYLEGLKNNPELQKFMMKIGEGNPPADWKMTSLPQFRGYYLEPRIADTFDYFNKQLYRGRDPIAVLTSLNRFLRTAIFFNPLIHVPNITTHAMVNRGISGISPTTWQRLVKTSFRAIQAVYHQNQDYLDMLDSGVNLMYHNQADNNLASLMLDKMGQELRSKDKLFLKIKKALGQINPYGISGKITWAFNDVATLQSIYENQEKGMTLKEAIDETSKHIPNYIIPSRVLNSKVLSEIMTNPNITMFGAYHYGALKSYGEMIKSIVGNVPFKEKKEALDKLAMLGFLLFVLYPVMDEALKEITGNKNAHIRRAGPATFPENINKLNKGQIDFSQAIQSIFTPAVGAKEGLEFVFNRDLFTGEKIVHQGQELKDIKDLVVESIAPLNAIARITDKKISLSDYLLSMVGISMTDPNKSKLYAMKDAKTAFQKEFDKMYAENPEKAKKAVKKFNDRQVNALSQVAKEEGLKEIPRSVIHQFIITTVGELKQPKKSAGEMLEKQHYHKRKRFSIRSEE